MCGKVIFGRVHIPQGGAVSIHDIRQLSAVISRDAKLLWFQLANFFHPSVVFSEQDMLEYFFSETLSGNFGYLIENHRTAKQPYKQIYERLISIKPELKNAMRYHGYSVYGDNTIRLSVIDDLLFLVYERMNDGNRT